MATSQRDGKGNLIPRPPYHPTIDNLIQQLQPSNTLTLESLPELRAQTSPTAEAVIGDRPIHHVEKKIRSPNSSHNVLISIFTSTASSASTLGARPCVLHIHGGGTVAGNRFLAMSEMLDWVVEFDLVVVSVEYRLAPEHPFPAGLEDCEVVLKELMENPDEYDVDADKVCLVAGSGGATIAAGLVLKLRDEGYAYGSKEIGDEALRWGTASGTSKDGVEQKRRALCGMLLYSPSLDHRLQTTSAKQFYDGGISDTKSAQIFRAWYIHGTSTNDTSTGTEVSMYASPGTAEDLTGLPPTYIDVGSCDAFRDESVEFASKMWRDGGDCELHVWPGGCHIYSVLCPNLDISKAAVRARKEWIKRTLCG